MKSLIVLILLALTSYTAFTQSSKTCIPDSALRKVYKAAEESKLLKEDLKDERDKVQVMAGWLADKDRTIIAYEEKVKNQDFMLSYKDIRLNNAEIVNRQQATEIRKLTRKARLGKTTTWLVSGIAVTFGILYLLK